MPNCRRNRVPGATYFFTVNLRDRRSDLLVSEVGSVRDVVRAVRLQLPFHIDAWVVLPDHMHCVWTLPEGDSDFPERWRRIKAGFTRSLTLAGKRSPTGMRKGERGVWQRRYWEHTIRDDRDYAAHVDYIHFNPVKHDLAENPEDWPFSSFHRYLAEGLYSGAWMGSGTEPPDTGER